MYLHIKNLLCEKCKKKDWKMFSNCLGSFLLRLTYSSKSRNKFTNVERTWKYNFRGGNNFQFFTSSYPGFISTFLCTSNAQKVLLRSQTFPFLCHLITFLCRGDVFTDIYRHCSLQVLISTFNKRLLEIVKHMRKYLWKLTFSYNSYRNITC